MGERGKEGRRRKEGMGKRGRGKRGRGVREGRWERGKVLGGYVVVRLG